MEKTTTSQQKSDCNSIEQMGKEMVEEIVKEVSGVKPRKTSKPNPTAAKNAAPDFSGDHVTIDVIESNVKRTMAVYLLLDEYITKIEQGCKLDKTENECFDILRDNAAAFSDWLINRVGADLCNDLVVASPRCKEIEEIFYNLGILASTYQTRLLRCAKRRLSQK